MPSRLVLQPFIINKESSFILVEVSNKIEHNLRLRDKLHLLRPKSLLNIKFINERKDSKTLIAITKKPTILIPSLRIPTEHII